MIEQPHRGQRVTFLAPGWARMDGEIMFVNRQDKTATVLFDGFEASDTVEWEHLELIEEPMGFTPKEKAEILAVLKRAHVIRLKAGSQVMFVITTDDPITMSDIARIGKQAAEVLRAALPALNVTNVIVLGGGMSLGAVEVTDIPKIKVQNAKS